MLWLLYFLAGCCSDGWKEANPVIREGFPCPLGPKATRWSVTSLIIQLRSHGSFTEIGVRHMVSLSCSVRPFPRDYYLIAGCSRWYRIFQCPWTTLFGFGFPENDHRPFREEVFELLRQNTNAYDDGLVCILCSLSPKIICHRSFPEWSGITPRPFSLTTRCGESRGKYFTSFSNLKRCPNTYLFKDEWPITFCEDYLSHPMISSFIFDSKPCLICGVLPRC